jgi:branched-chain amino acid transport system ATP-binding protein
MLEVENLNVEIQNSEILRNVAFEVAAGELVCLVGRNGAGKTTTLRTIMGYLRPKKGVIRLGGNDLAGLSTLQRARLGIGYAPETSEVFAELGENIEMPTWTRRTERSADDRIRLAYQVFPQLRRYMTRPGTHLSGGERKMLSIARTLALDARLLLLDEPFEGLSPTVIPSIKESIREIVGFGRTILIAESELQHVPEYSNRLYVIERGEIVFAGDLAQARNNAAVRRITGENL